MERIDPRRLGNGIREGFYQTHLGTGGSLSIQENTCERREHVSMENIITNTKIMMGERRDGCDCANFAVGGGSEEKQEVLISVSRLSFTQLLSL